MDAPNRATPAASRDAGYTNRPSEPNSPPTFKLRLPQKKPQRGTRCGFLIPTPGEPGYAALTILPERMHLVQTRIRFGAPFTSARTR